MQSELSTIEIQPQSAHKYSVIWLHGLGADGHDFEGMASELHLNAESNIHFIFPNAPIQPITVNGGMHMRAWYDILEMSLERKVDMAGIYQSAKLVEQLIEQEMDKGVPSEHILLAGFSQGGVIALHAGLSYPHKLAGIIGLSTYLPTLEQLKTERSAANNAVPIFMGHGILDSVVAIESAKAAFHALNDLEYKVEWHDYLMEHSVCIEETGHISSFINGIFS
ncbi:MAG: carboxylesterase [Methylococcaceae bacterium]|jgi:phospholipase/carboxylesterase|nr:carboxylesterase [Methylococcaceae bacterium]OYV19147.1 MAG: Carboxylesterase [Methylococcaceae bacterium NSM2-1]